MAFAQPAAISWPLSARSSRRWSRSRETSATAPRRADPREPARAARSQGSRSAGPHENPVRSSARASSRSSTAFAAHQLVKRPGRSARSFEKLDEPIERPVIEDQARRDQRLLGSSLRTSMRESITCSTTKFFLTPWLSTRTRCVHITTPWAPRPARHTPAQLPSSAIPITSQTTCSAGSQRRRSVAVPVACSASSMNTGPRRCEASCRCPR